MKGKRASVGVPLCAVRCAPGARLAYLKQTKFLELGLSFPLDLLSGMHRMGDDRVASSGEDVAVIAPGRTGTPPAGVATSGPRAAGAWGGGTRWIAVVTAQRARRCGAAWVFASALALAFVLPWAGCNTPPLQPLPPPPPGSWLVFLCKASDNASEPNAQAFYQALFASGTPDLLWDYFDKVSGSRVEISGSRVFGWFPMGVTTSEILARNAAAPVTRSRTATDCRNAGALGLAGRGLSTDFSQYRGVISFINVAADSGKAAGANVVASDGHASIEVGFLVHEMLHVHGLADSRRATQDVGPDHIWQSGPDTVYDDCWDMMSFRSCVFGFTSTRGFQGPELQVTSLERLGWLGTGRVFEAPLVGPATAVTLNPVGSPGGSGFLMARVEVPGRGWYVVEYREAARFDRGTGAPSVLVRERRNNGQTAIVHRSDGRIDWAAGEVFTDSQNYLSIRVDRVGGGSATVTINTAASAGALPLGGMCGDKYRGQVHACIAPGTCATRRLGSGLQTVDWFCQ